MYSHKLFRSMYELQMEISNVYRALDVSFILQHLHA